MFKLIKKIICKYKGHDWEVYAYMPKWGRYDYDAEMAGHCKRCGADTHQG